MYKLIFLLIFLLVPASAYPDGAEPTNRRWEIQAIGSESVRHYIELDGGETTARITVAKDTSSISLYNRNGRTRTLTGTTSLIDSSSLLLEVDGDKVLVYASSDDNSTWGSSAILTGTNKVRY